jgi:hypothetical protein
LFFLPRQFFLELPNGFRVVAGDPALAYRIRALLVIIGLLACLDRLAGCVLNPVAVVPVPAFRVVANGETAALL